MPFPTTDRLVIFDADGTLVDAFPAVATTFVRHGMDIGDLERFRRRRRLLKYLGGLREFPKNFRRQLDTESRRRLRQSLTEVYRREASLFPGMPGLLLRLIDTEDIRVGIVSRNVTIEPVTSLEEVLGRHGIDPRRLDFIRCIPLGASKTPEFQSIRASYGINPARAFVCGDEPHDYAAALAAGMTPLIAAYGFEDHARLTRNFEIPEEIIARTPDDLGARLLHALGLQAGRTRLNAADASTEKPS